MTQDIVYTLGIIIAILLLMLFLRSILIRRQRLAAAQATTLNFPPTTWQFRNVHGMDVVRPEPVVNNSSTPLPVLSRTRTQDSDSRDQLPRYEAPPPGYDVIVKDQERRDAREGEERGESSSAGPPRYSTPGRGGDEAVVVVVNETTPGSPGLARPSPVTSRTAGREGLFRVDVRRAWAGFGR